MGLNDVRIQLIRSYIIGMGESVYCSGIFKSLSELADSSGSMVDMHLLVTSLGEQKLTFHNSFSLVLYIILEVYDIYNDIWHVENRG